MNDLGWIRCCSFARVAVVVPVIGACLSPPLATEGSDEPTSAGTTAVEPAVDLPTGSPGHPCSEGQVPWFMAGACRDWLVEHCRSLTTRGSCEARPPWSLNSVDFACEWVDLVELQDEATCAVAEIKQGCETAVQVETVGRSACPDRRGVEYDATGRRFVVGLMGQGLDSTTCALGTSPPRPAACACTPTACAIASAMHATPDPAVLAECGPPEPPLSEDDLGFSVTGRTRENANWLAQGGRVIIGTAIVEEVSTSRVVLRMQVPNNELGDLEITTPAARPLRLKVGQVVFVNALGGDRSGSSTDPVSVVVRAATDDTAPLLFAHYDGNASRLEDAFAGDVGFRVAARESCEIAPRDGESCFMGGSRRLYEVEFDTDPPARLHEQTAASLFKGEQAYRVVVEAASVVQGGMPTCPDATGGSYVRLTIARSAP